MQSKSTQHTPLPSAAPRSCRGKRADALAPLRPVPRGSVRKPCQIVSPPIPPLTADPHEVQQRRLIKRVVHSVERLNSVLETLNDELGQLDDFRQDVDRAHAVWNGVNKKLDLAFSGGLVPAEPSKASTPSAAAAAGGAAGPRHP